MKASIYFLALSLLTLCSCTSQKSEPEFGIVYSDNNEMTVLNVSMYRNLLNEDIYFNFDESEVIRDMFIFSDVMKQERDDYRQNKVKEVKMILDYGKDSTKKDFALMKINTKGFIQEYIPQYSKVFKSSMKFIYDDAERLTEILGTNPETKKDFSWYRFLYYDKQIQKFIKWQGSQFPQEYELKYSGDENQFLYISGYNTLDNYYRHYNADFNNQNKISGFYSGSSFDDSRIFYSGTNENSPNENSLDTIKCTKGSLTKYYILKNNRMVQRIVVMEEFTSKRTVPRQEYERINYYYSANNLLERIESSARGFPDFNLYFEYEYYE